MAGEAARVGSFQIHADSLAVIPAGEKVPLRGNQMHGVADSFSDSHIEHRE